MGLIFVIRGAKMETCPILIPLRRLRFDGGSDFCDEGHDDHGYQREERNRCFIDCINHNKFHSNLHAENC